MSNKHVIFVFSILCIIGLWCLYGFTAHQAYMSLIIISETNNFKLIVFGYIAFFVSLTIIFMVFMLATKAIIEIIIEVYEE